MESAARCVTTGPGPARSLHAQAVLLPALQSPRLAAPPVILALGHLLSLPLTSRHVHRTALRWSYCRCTHAKHSRQPFPFASQALPVAGRCMAPIRTLRLWLSSRVVPCLSRTVSAAPQWAVVRSPWMEQEARWAGWPCFQCRLASMFPYLDVIVPSPLLNLLLLAP